MGLFFVPWPAVLAEVDLEPVAGLALPRYGLADPSALEHLRAQATTP